MDSLKNLKQLHLNKLEWSPKSFKISDFLQKFTLPQVVKVIEGFYGENEETSLGADQILSLHCMKSTDKLLGKDYRGKEINIPLHCQNKVEVRPSNMKDVYDNVEELCTAFPRFVRISQGYYNMSTDEEVLNVGDKLELKRIDKSKKGQERLICVNQNGQVVELPKDCVAGFQPLLDGKEYFLAEIVKKLEMPFYIQFIDPPTMEKRNASSNANFFNSNLGAIYIESSFAENLIIASTISQDGERTVVTFPRQLDIRLSVCEGMLQNSVAYAELCQMMDNGMDLKSLALIDAMSAFQPRNSVREFLYKDLVDIPSYPQTHGIHSSSEVTNNLYDEVVQSSTKIAPVDQASQVAVTDNAKTSANDEHKETTEKCTKQVDEIPPKPEIVNATKKFPPEKSSPPVATKKSLTDNSTTPAVTEKDTSFEDSPKPKRDPDPKDNQGSAKSQNESVALPTTDDPKEDEKTSKRSNVSAYTVKQVSEILKELGMDRYIVKFQSEMIDGEMLLCLDDDILMADFGMNKLHCMKLKKYLDGWTPKV
ncbi:uncharacterized protein LOC124450632 [Xenia sp. Carnegie-2017]|uniref:uncharacterized protein LOC124450632 n=1 Tax=Xenia sp. Carnegie-2017 TaxID=2897299 RepID=UPI001F042855|nr:uncharacterized protein LOC124450632 [Xenia sp. Carnegie-2017]